MAGLALLVGISHRVVGCRLRDEQSFTRDEPVVSRNH
jgi:hypothetical protein